MNFHSDAIRGGDYGLGKPVFSREDVEKIVEQVIKKGNRFNQLKKEIEF